MKLLESLERLKSSIKSADPTLSDVIIFDLYNQISLIIDLYVSQSNSNKEGVNPRFFLDIRSGCAAVRDSQHPLFDKDYPGLHSDTVDVVEYKHGFKNSENGYWEMLDKDVEYLTNYCASLNQNNSNL